MTFPDRPLLRPGVLLTRRGDGHLQIGLDADLAVVTPDCVETRAFLDGLVAEAAPPVTPGVRRLAETLLHHTLIVDGNDLRADLARGAASPEATAAAYAQSGLGAAGVLAQRARRPVRVDASTLADTGSGLDAHGLAHRLLEADGVPTTGDPYAVLVLQRGEINRSRVDELTRVEQPHLLLWVAEGIVRLGPFVVPGVTACLRCVDAHLGEADPRRALVVEQYAQATGPRADEVPEPIEPAVLTAAVAWAVRDVVSFIDDHVPTTWSSTVGFGPGMEQRRSEWRRHPLCGCSWTQADPAADVGLAG